MIRRFFYFKMSQPTISLYFNQPYLFCPIWFIAIMVALIAFGTLYIACICFSWPPQEISALSRLVSLSWRPEDHQTLQL